MNGEFLARMEDVLHLYSLPYNAQHPVVCFDERPCVLHGEVVEPLQMRPGKPHRQDYEYERKGTCCLLVAVEPLTGFRMVEVSKQRTARDYTRFMQKIAKHYKAAGQIRLVQDNLNTHTAASFYKHLPAAEAFALAQHFDVHYTPKKGSWLNMAELEISAMVRQCLGRRIESRERMTDEVGQLVNERNEQKARVHWQFTPEAARQKLKRHYQKVLHK
ncbi:MAG: IS630 family transposase [Candidatus Binatia bacterium]